MGAFWNIPVVAYMPTTSVTTDRNIYKTLVRTSSKNVNSLAKAVIRLVQHYNWVRVAIATNQGQLAYDRVAAFEDEFRKSNIIVSKKVMFEEFAKAEDIVRDPQMQELANSARSKITVTIIVTVFDKLQYTSNYYIKFCHFSRNLRFLQHP